MADFREKEQGGAARSLRTCWLTPQREEDPMEPDARIRTLLGVELPILQAPMAGAQDSALAIAVCEAGGLGALPCAMLSPDQIRAEVAAIRAATARPFNLNFFCHAKPAPDPEREAAWRERLAPYYRETGADMASIAAATRAPFDETFCALVEELQPPVVSFHFGLPAPRFVARVKAAGAKVLSSATTVAEARWLAEHGCHAIIAQGAEAGGHRGMFLTQDVAAQVGTMALVPQVVDAVRLPVIASGGLADARGIVASLALGAGAVQIGTAYLLTPEATIGATWRQALAETRDDASVLTNVFTGRPARGMRNRLIDDLGPLSAEAPAFPLASAAVAPLRAKTEPRGDGAFTSLWSGQAARLARAEPAFDMTRRLAAEADALRARLAG
jgi:nitronate monooxygenase